MTASMSGGYFIFPLAIRIISPVRRAEHLPLWTHMYNWHRPHGA